MVLKLSLGLSSVPKLLLFLKPESFNDPQKGSSSSGEEKVKNPIYPIGRGIYLSILGPLVPLTIILADPGLSYPSRVCKRDGMHLSNDSSHEIYISTA